jgi:ornithine--oxo-acid transaminase
MTNKTSQWIEAENRYCAQNYYPLPVVLSRGEGVWLWDIEGKRYLDMMSAYSAVSFGHSHPRLVKALVEQAQKLNVVSRAFHQETMLPCFEKLCQISGMDAVLPMNTGAEAVETAIKAARRWGYEKKRIANEQAEIIVMDNNFHGRTTTIVGFSSDVDYKKHFGPFAKGFCSVPFGDIQAIQNAIQKNTCALLIEPIQGEAGIVLPPEGWLKSCAKLCQQENILLIVDEVQSGLGRTGKLFAFQHENIVPDGLILGKALGGGLLPVSAFLAKKEVMDVFNAGSHGSTFGGNPLACRIALEALEILHDEKLVENSAELGKYLLEGLSHIQHPLIKAVRGKGLWVGVEFDNQKKSAREVCLALMDLGLLTKEAHDKVIRFAPPLIIDKDTLIWAIERFHQALSTL